MACELPKEILNAKICYALSFVRDWYYSIMKSQAADQPDGFPIEADLIRLKDRVEDMKIQWTYLCSRPFLDTPESSGCLFYALPLLDELPEPENKDVKYISNMLKMMHFEMATCTSARMSGIVEFDRDRFFSYLADVESLISEYIEARTPNDWSKAAPEKDRVGPGRTAV